MIKKILESNNGFLWFISIYLLVLYASRSFLFSGAGYVDSEQILFSQILTPGYVINNPPLFTWLVIAAQQIVGVTTLSVEAVKFTLVLLTYILFFKTACRVLADRRLAVLSSLSLLGIYYYAWEGVMNFSHSLILVLCCVAIFYLLLRLEKKKNTLSYVLLGLVIGLGFISKYNFLLFLVTMMAASLCDPEIRKRLVNPKIALTFIAALLVSLPHLGWFLDSPLGIVSVLTSKLRGDGAVIDSYWPHVGAGLADLTKALRNFLLPLIVGYVLFFLGAFKPLRSSSAGSVATSHIRYRRLLGRQILFVLMILIGAVFGFGATQISTHYLLVLILFPIYFFSRVEAAGFKEKALTRFATFMIVLALLVEAVLVGKFLFDPMRCKKCYYHIPYAGFADDLRHAGFVRGTIVSWSYPYRIGENLRRYFPQSRIISNRAPDFTPPLSEDAAPGQCLLIWDQDRADKIGGIEGLATAEAARRLGVATDHGLPVHTVSRPMEMSDDRQVRFSYILFPQGSGNCR